jgi:hypothetical protein
MPQTIPPITIRIIASAGNARHNAIAASRSEYRRTSRGSSPRLAMM